MKKILSLVLALAMVLGLAACGSSGSSSSGGGSSAVSSGGSTSSGGSSGSGSGSTSGGTSSSGTSSSASGSGSVSEPAGSGSVSEPAGSGSGSGSGAPAASGDMAGICQTPAVLTSIGQSADVDIVNTLCQRAGVEVTEDAGITADAIPEGTRTLILSVGGSSKGLGAAGIDADQELERTKALLAKAEEDGITILAMHTGGTARRGTLSDSFINPVFAAADAGIVVSEGDSDGLMAGLLEGAGAPSIYLESVTEAIDALKTAFGV